ncbi:hypothetical protein Cgig2_005099 [Carnegiea gigantea]|uniref:UDP-glycosyltransferase n=1 Tax=Carnegiea gigantea TaxID=171969 RepID=A0A9Q1L1H2_9CARY|nr:hypothetical protein Cgig2_005099 [Carnegiea gigantea]
MLDRGETYREFVNVGAQMANSDGVIVNSFEGFEPRAAIILAEGVCVPKGFRTPPVYCVGPLISAADSGGGGLAGWVLGPRTKGRGFVVKSWVPQTAILAHEAIGAFMTHCGWNSTSQAVCAGVPLIAWPLFAEQRFNRVVLVEEARVALPMDEEEGTRLISSDEIERRVREITGSEEGVDVRQRMLDMRNKAKLAIGEDGSSTLALTKLIESWRR